MNANKSRIDLACFFLLILVFIPIRLKNISEPLRNITSFRQAQTATVALNFHKNGINFFKSELDIFGSGKEKYLTLEFPLYQSIVALLYRLFFVSDMFGRIVSVVSGFIASYALFLSILRLISNRSLALLSVFFFLAAPLNMFYQQEFLIESFVIAILLVAFYNSLAWIDTGKHKHFILSVVLFSLGFMQKIMYGPFLYMPLLWFFLQKQVFKNKNKLIFFISLFLPVAVYLIWQNQADNINIENNRSYFTSTNPSHIEWNMGKIGDRFNLGIWKLRLNSILNGIFLKPGLLIFLIGILALIKKRRFHIFYFWLFAEIIYLLIFFRIQSHFYYQMILIPITSVFLASGLLILSKPVRFFFKLPVQLLFISIFSAFYLWRSIISSNWDASLDLNWYSRIKQVGKSVSNEKSGIIVNPKYDWNSVYSYYPKLKLLSVSADDLTQTNLSKWKDLGHTYLILHYYKDYPEKIRLLASYQKILELEDFQVYLL